MNGDRRSWACAIVGVALAVGCGDPAAGTQVDAAALDARASDAERTPDAAPDDARDPGDSGPTLLDARAPDASPGCGAPGTLETIACGMCGTMQRFCTAAGAWSDGPCTAEMGECVPGTMRTIACGMCGAQTSLCTTACTWASEQGCMGEGECMPGATTHGSAGCPAMQSRDFVCDAACTLQPTSACATDGCPTPGTLEHLACGMCGTQDRFCDAAHAWEYGTCGGESGVCMPGTTGTMPCGRCGTRSALCDTTCAWIGSGACTGEGPCTAGTSGACTTSCGSTGAQSCSPTCTPGACTPPPETCGDAGDDDCDGAIDEGCAVACAACAGAVAITGTGGRASVYVSANAQRGSCGGNGNEGVVSFTLASTSDVFVTTLGANVDTVLYARSCSCSGPEIGCNDDAAGGNRSVLELTGLAPGTYDVFVDTFAPGFTGVIPVDVYIAPPGPAGARCGNPLPIAAGVTTLSGATCTLGADYDTGSITGCTNAAAGDGEDAVYYFSLSTTSTVTFSGCGTGAFDYDGVLYVRTICNATGTTTESGCDDDGCGSTWTPDRAPTLSLTLAPGLYYAFVDGYGTTGARCGSYALSVSGIR